MKNVLDYIFTWHDMDFQRWLGNYFNRTMMHPELAYQRITGRRYIRPKDFDKVYWDMFRRSLYG